MVTTNSEWTFIFSGLSTDHKPLPDRKSNGSFFIETDTGRQYVYNYDAKSWTLLDVGGGGGGSGSTVTKSDINGNIVVNGAEMIVYKMPTSYVDYLDKVTYQKPTINEFILKTATATPGTVFETGDTFTLTKFTHSETNVSNITGELKIGSQTVTPTATSTTVNLDAPITVNSTKTITITGTDSKGGAVSKSVTYTFNNYSYTNVIASDVTPTIGNTKGAEVSSFMSSGKNMTYTKGDYIYFFIKQNSKEVQTKVLNQWSGVTHTKLGAINIVQANGTVAQFYGYRVGPMIGSGSAEYRVN